MNSWLVNHSCKPNSKVEIRTFDNEQLAEMKAEMMDARGERKEMKRRHRELEDGVRRMMADAFRVSFSPQTQLWRRFIIFTRIPLHIPFRHSPFHIPFHSFMLICSFTCRTTEDEGSWRNVFSVKESLSLSSSLLHCVCMCTSSNGFELRSYITHCLRTSL